MSDYLPQVITETRTLRQRLRGLLTIKRKKVQGTT